LIWARELVRDRKIVDMDLMMEWLSETQKILVETLNDEIRQREKNLWKEIDKKIEDSNKKMERLNKKIERQAKKQDKRAIANHDRINKIFGNIRIKERFNILKNTKGVTLEEKLDYLEKNPLTSSIK